MPVIGYCRNLHANLCPCFICSKKFSLDNGVEDLLTHVCFTHQVIIRNIDQIADFQKYMEYYVNRYKEAPLESFTQEFTIEITQTDAEPRERKYYVLGDVFLEDKALRKNLHSIRLKTAQKQQKKDLSLRHYVRQCFYCHETFDVTNIQWINHLRSHGFQLGHPEKLVYIEKFIEAIEYTFRRLRCLYCDVEFKSCRALINHMEERGHLKIHPNDRFYDQFYIINYIEFGKTWLDFINDKSNSKGEPDSNKMEDDKDWCSWGSEPENIMCLFCKHMCKSWDGTLLHLQVSHNFDFQAKVARLSFYQQVAAVNYIRRRILHNQCINCDYQAGDMLIHMEKNDHLVIPDEKLWDHPEYLFCSLDNDMFLCHLEDENGYVRGACTSDSEEIQNIFNSEIMEKPNIEHDQNDTFNGRNSGTKGDSVSSMDEDEHEQESSIEDLEKTIANIKFEVCQSLSDDNNLKTEFYHEKMELSSSAHVGAGDSVQIASSGGSAAVKQVTEFGDAQK